MDNGPSGTGRATKQREDEEPSEEDEEDIGSPDTRVLEPGGVLVEIRRRCGLHVEASQSKRSKVGHGYGDGDLGFAEKHTERKKLRSEEDDLDRKSVV